MRTGVWQAGHGDVDRRQSRADDVAGRCAHGAAARLAALVRHVAHLNAAHVHADGGKAVAAGDERQQEQQGEQPSCEGALHDPDYATVAVIRKIEGRATGQLATS